MVFEKQTQLDSSVTDCISLVDSILLTFTPLWYITIKSQLLHCYFSLIPMISNLPGILNPFWVLAFTFHLGLCGVTES